MRKLLLVNLMRLACASASSIIPASDPRIAYTGRVQGGAEFRDEPGMNWPMTGFAVTVSKTSIFNATFKHIPTDATHLIVEVDT